MENASTKNFMLGHFVDYKKEESKIVCNQVHELQDILMELQDERIVQVVAIIENFPLHEKISRPTLSINKRKCLRWKKMIIFFNIGYIHQHPRII